MCMNKCGIWLAARRHIILIYTAFKIGLVILKKVMRTLHLLYITNNLDLDQTTPKMQRDQGS